MWLENPKKRSLSKSAASGIRNAKHLSEKYAPPKRAMADIDAKLGGCGIKRDAAATRTIVISTNSRSFSMSISYIFHSEGNKSQNQKESRQTISPKENFTGFLKIGPSKTKVWNSPFSPQGSTCGGSWLRKSSSMTRPTNDGSSFAGSTHTMAVLNPNEMKSLINFDVSRPHIGYRLAMLCLAISRSRYALISSRNRSTK